MRIDIPKDVDITQPGHYPHAHGKGWSVNIDGTMHDVKKNTKPIPNKVKEALRKAGWDC